MHDLDRFLAALAGILGAIVLSVATGNFLGGPGMFGRYLAEAVIRGDEAHVERFLHLGVDVNYEAPHPQIYTIAESDEANDWHEHVFVENTVQLTPLMLAVYYDRETLAVTLMQAGARVNIEAEDGATALRLAQSFGRYALVKPLIDAGARLEGVLPRTGQAKPFRHRQKPDESKPAFRIRPSG